MRILVATEKIAVGLSVSRCLASAGHTVTEERETAAVVQRAETGDFDVVIIDNSLSGEAWLPLLQRLRAGQSYFFVIVLGHTKHTAEATTAFNMGADDYVRVPFDRAELVARLLPAERIRSLLRSSLRPRHDPTQQISSLSAWQNLETRTTAELSAMLNAECALGLPHTEWQAPRVVQLDYSLPQQQLGVVFHMVAEASALSAMTELMLGTAETAPEVLGEVASEVLNTLGGSFKRDVPSAKLEMTTGLPEESSLEAMVQAREEAAEAKTWTIDWAGHGIFVCATIRQRANTPVLVKDLCEGMVLSTEIRNSAGVLLIAPGTRLTTTAIHHIGRVVGDKFQVMVTAA